MKNYLDKASKNAQASALDRRGFIGICGVAALSPALKPLLRVSPPSVPKGRVVMVRNPHAVSFPFNSSDFYGNHVNQADVDRMVEEGVMALTGAENPVEAWMTIFPDFKRGRIVAIKCNFNNSGTYDKSNNHIDTSVQPLNSVISGLLSIGANERDIWIYDSVRVIPERFVNGCRYSGVRFFDRSGADGKELAHHDTGVPVAYSDTSIPEQRICNVLVEADWLVNMPIMRRHTGAGVTLGFKNHFGTINNCAWLHTRVYPDGSLWRRDYNPLVDISSNPHIRDKTALVLGDGLFGNAYGGPWGMPHAWKAFEGGSPSCLFFSRDLVAVDSVMHDVLRLECEDIKPNSDGYMPLAQAAGLGVFEHGDPSQTAGYKRIDFIRVDQPRRPESLTGFIRSGGKPVGLARVKAVNLANGRETKVRADAAGRYSFSRLKTGEYRIVVRSGGFKVKSRQIVVVGDGTTTAANFTMRRQ